MKIDYTKVEGQITEKIIKQIADLFETEKELSNESNLKSYVEEVCCQHVMGWFWANFDNDGKLIRGSKEEKKIKKNAHRQIFRGVFYSTPYAKREYKVYGGIAKTKKLVKALIDDNFNKGF